MDKKKILTVDDSASIRTLMRFHLEQAGYEVLEAGDGAEAQNVLNGDANIHLIITDLHMPNMNGLEFIEWVRKQQAYRFTPILFLTTETNTAMKDRARKAGATGWIVKPFEPEKVIKTVKKVLR